MSWDGCWPSEHALVHKHLCVCETQRHLWLMTFWWMNQEYVLFLCYIFCYIWSMYMIYSTFILLYGCLLCRVYLNDSSILPWTIICNSCIYIHLFIYICHIYIHLYNIWIYMSDVVHAWTTLSLYVDTIIICKLQQQCGHSPSHPPGHAPRAIPRSFAVKRWGLMWPFKRCQGLKESLRQLSNVQKILVGCLIGDYTIQVYADYNKPI